MVTTTSTATLDPNLALSEDFADLVRRHVDGRATADELELLRANEQVWARVLYRLLDDVAESIDDVRTTVRGHQRAVVMADLEADYRAVDDVLAELVGPARAPLGGGEPETGVAELQLSWIPGRVIAWAAGHGAPPEEAEAVRARLDDCGAATVDWEPYRPVKLAGRNRAETVSAPVESCLGWLVALGDTAGEEGIGPSVAWLGLVAALAVRLTAQGRIVPQLKKLRRRRDDNGAGNGDDGPPRRDTAAFAVQWSPALVETEALASLADSLPGAAAAFENQRDRIAFTQAVLGDLVDAVVSQAAERLDVPAPPPDPKTRAEAAEAMLAHLDGEPFEVPSRHGSELARRLDQWSRPVTGPHDRGLVVQLDPPDESGAWHLSVLSISSAGELQPVESALVNASPARRHSVRHQLARLERLYPELLRLGGRRRGEVLLGQDEAWTLMTEKGLVLTAGGYDVRVPALSRRRPRPSLRLTALEAQDSMVGAQQLADVRWSVVFDDVELAADEIRHLAAQARPLVKSRGRWVEIERADLTEAAEALAERAGQTRLTGADMLRHTLGLEGSPLAGGVAIAGEGWAADLIRSAQKITGAATAQPDGFCGALRSYQAEALGWLGFLDEAGMGGCLALDMGLGKTPTMLAHIDKTVGDGAADGPSLVIAPPAVVGNWASEARRFVPDLEIVVHHGPSRIDKADVPALAAGVHLVITSYGTALRDIDGFERVDWSKVVLDEAQAIKNPASETGQQLRRLRARSRVALTGTPIENGLGDLWTIMDFCNPGLVGARAPFIAEMSKVSEVSEGDEGDSGGEGVLAALNGILVFRRTKAEPQIAAELPDRIDELDRCTMTAEQIGLYQAVLDRLVATADEQEPGPKKKGAVLAAITALKQICNHPVNYIDDGGPLGGRSGKLARLNEILEVVLASDERVLIFTHFATWGERLAEYLTEQTGLPIDCYHGGLARRPRDEMVARFQRGSGPGALVLSIKAGGTGLNLTAASHVVLYDRWWNPAVEDQARDRAWRIGQRNTVVCHRLVCPGTVDERVEEIVAGKRRIADMVLPKSSSIGDLDSDQLRAALGIDSDLLLMDDENGAGRP